MIYIKRAIREEFRQKVLPNKVLILLGARRVGKTCLINEYLKDIPKKEFLKLNGEDIRDIEILENRSIQHYQRVFNNISLLVIDEAQKIPEIGLILKLIVDHIKGLKIIVTGSSVFDLKNQLGEPLVGRKNTIHLYPLSQLELSKIENFKETNDLLEERLLYGSYPELIQYKSLEEKREYLFEIINSYLLKDILVFEGLKHSDKIFDLLRLISFQIGKEISLSELANQLNIGSNTVSRYLDLLSKVFILYKLNGYSKNLRKEITKSSRWYFTDNGLLNGIINNFNPISKRNDIGELWENYLTMERIKFQNYKQLHINNYFWRTYDQQEIDWIEESDGKLSATEIKWNEKRKTKIPTAWLKAYPEASFNIINNKNYLEWIT